MNIEGDDEMALALDSYGKVMECSGVSLSRRLPGMPVKRLISELNGPSAVVVEVFKTIA